MQTMLPKLTDYWDSSTRAIDICARQLGELSLDQKVIASRELSAAVSEHMRVLPDKLLVQAAIPIMDDLYKTSCWIDRWDANLAVYLDATAGVFVSTFAERGFTVRYLADNEFDDMERPMRLFPEWFRAAGIVYACPQVVGCELVSKMEGENVPPSERLPNYIDEARAIVESVLDRCRAESRHFFLLDTDFDERSFHASLQEKDANGTLTIFRNEAPEPGTKVVAWLPKELRE
jgi:hypothetical protein